MTEQAQDGDNFFFGVMVLKEGKWTPHSKYDGNSFGSALIKAEALDEEREYDGVRLMKIPGPGATGEPKPQPQEMWISPHLKARMEAQAAAAVRNGAKQTKQTMANEHAKRKAEFRGS